MLYVFVYELPNFALTFEVRICLHAFAGIRLNVLGAYSYGQQTAVKTINAAVAGNIAQDKTSFFGRRENAE
jgi:hypothetical protein